MVVICTYIYSHSAYVDSLLEAATADLGLVDSSPNYCPIIEAETGSICVIPCTLSPIPGSLDITPDAALIAATSGSPTYGTRARKLIAMGKKFLRSASPTPR